MCLSSFMCYKHPLSRYYGWCLTGTVKNICQKNNFVLWYPFSGSSLVSLVRTSDMYARRSEVLIQSLVFYQTASNFSNISNNVAFNLEGVNKEDTSSSSESNSSSDDSSASDSASQVRSTSESSSVLVM